MIKGSQAFLKTLESAGVKFIFGTPGSTEIALLSTLYDLPGIKYLLSLNESVAVAMADGYARASCTLGVVSVHATVGTANTMGMVINAYADYIPVIITAGIKDSRDLGGGVFCDAPFNVADLLRQYTRWSWQCIEPQNISRDTAAAFQEALPDPQGPTFLAIPQNFWDQEVEEIIQVPSTTSKFQSVAAAEEINHAIELIAKAKRPIILSGNEVGKQDVANNVAILAEKLHAPVFSEDALSWAYLNFPTNHSLYCGCYNPNYSLIGKADLLIGIGAKMFMKQDYSMLKHIAPKTKVIHLHPDARQIGSHYPTQVGLVGSVKNNVSSLLTGLSESKLPERDVKWRDLLIQHQQERNRRLTDMKSNYSESKLPNIFQLVSELSKRVSSDAVIVNEGIRSGFYLQEYFELPLSRLYYGSTGGCLGWGTPAALGVKLALPERQVIAFVGDGSFLFSNQALWTAAHYKIDIKIIVCNNRGYMAIKSRLKKYRDNLPNKEHLLGEFTDPTVDFVALSRSFGVPALRVETPEELQSKIEKILQTPGPALLEVMLDTAAMEVRPV